jgi:bifunctional DNA-binding transcriptional regulator/antitoxin component of YhaV-PrlF toxin-antitoxin module
MPKVSAKRQITLPISGCNELAIQAGDEVEIFRNGNQFNIIKKEIGMAAGLLKGAKINNTVSDVQSRQKHLNDCN